jgi:hypothetical protein
VLCSVFVGFFILLAVSCLQMLRMARGFAKRNFRPAEASTSFSEEKEAKRLFLLGLEL